MMRKLRSNHLSAKPMNTTETAASVTPLFSGETIRNRVAELGAAISEDFRNLGTAEPLFLITILKGAFVFAADLARCITVPCTFDFLSASSYGAAKISSGSVTLRHSLSVANRHVLLIEDIVDTGLTLQHITDELSKQQPASLGICTLLDKPAARKHPVRIAYTGFSIPDRFVFGYGIDYGEHYRQLPFIGFFDT
jgi:hypoxanthine phosphoribosyltransferase